LIPPVSAVERLTSPLVSFFASPLRCANTSFPVAVTLDIGHAVKGHHSAPGRSIPHEFVEEGLDGSARPEFPWYQEPPSIAYCMHDRQIGTDCILRENLFASNFSSDGTTPAESFL